MAPRVSCLALLQPHGSLPAPHPAPHPPRWSPKHTAASPSIPPSSPVVLSLILTDGQSWDTPQWDWGSAQSRELVLLWLFPCCPANIYQG